MSKLDPEIVQLIKQVVQKELLARTPGTLRVFGQWSQKKLGEELGRALLEHPIVVIDGRGIKAVSGNKPSLESSPSGLT